MQFSTAHIATLLRYTGISFIAGSVTHGVFSEKRSLVTALIGVVLFIIASLLESRDQSQAKQSWTSLIGFGIMASIGLGFFTGGLQHFPDSPDRSLWVVPLGFVLSVLATHWLDKGLLKDRLKYVCVGFLLVVCLSVSAWLFFDDHHDAAHDHADARTPAAMEQQPLAPASVANAPPAPAKKDHGHKH
jgi:drug/metabolite transporter (DMT)-like permease